MSWGITHLRRTQQGVFYVMGYHTFTQKTTRGILCHGVSHHYTENNKGYFMSWGITPLLHRRHPFQHCLDLSFPATVCVCVSRVCFCVCVWVFVSILCVYSSLCRSCWHTQRPSACGDICPVPNSSPKPGGIFIPLKYSAVKGVTNQATRVVY